MIKLFALPLSYCGMTLLTLLSGSCASTARSQTPPNPPPQSAPRFPSQTPRRGISPFQNPDLQDPDIPRLPLAGSPVTVQGADLKDGQINAAFCPGQEAIAICVREIDAAKATVRVQTFQMLSFPVAQALQGAVRRGV